MALYKCGGGGTPELLYEGKISGASANTTIHSNFIPNKYRKLICVFAGKIPGKGTDGNRGAYCFIAGSQDKKNLTMLAYSAKRENDGHCQTIICDYYPYISAGYDKFLGDGTYAYSSLVVYGVK